MSATTVRFDCITPSEDVRCEVTSTGEAMLAQLKKTPTNHNLGPIYREVTVKRTFDDNTEVSLYFPQWIYPNHFKSILHCVSISRTPAECQKCQHISLTRLPPK